MNLETQTIRCESASPEEIVSEIAAAFGDTPLAMKLFFASPRVPFTRLAQLMHDQIPGEIFRVTFRQGLAQKKQQTFDLGLLFWS